MNSDCGEVHLHRNTQKKKKGAGMAPAPSLGPSIRATKSWLEFARYIGTSRAPAGSPAAGLGAGRVNPGAPPPGHTWCRVQRAPAHWNISRGAPPFASRYSGWAIITMARRPVSMFRRVTYAEAPTGAFTSYAPGAIS